VSTKAGQDQTPFVAFTVPDFSNPGAFEWGPILSLQPKAPYFDGKVVVLVDETTQSQAEYTAMALRASPNATVVGSTTAGADGNLSTVVLPGDLRAGLSGFGVFYSDRTPTQRIGIIPDTFVAPTVAEIKEGRDEVLEQGLREILDDQAEERIIRDLASR